MPYLVPFGAPDGERAVADGPRPQQPLLDPVARRFHPDRCEPRFVDLGLYYCVNPHLVDDRGPEGVPRRLLLGWVLGARSPVDTAPYWIGAHSIPRVLELAGDELVQSPVTGDRNLRGPLRRQRDLAVVPGARGHLAHVAGDALELDLTVDLRRTRAHRFGAALRVSGDGRGAPASATSRQETASASTACSVRSRSTPTPPPPGAVTRRGHRRNCTRRRSPHRPGPFTERPSPCASSWTVPSWRGTAAAPRSPTACIPTPPPPASTCSRKAELPTSTRFRVATARPLVNVRALPSAIRRAESPVQHRALQHAQKAAIIADRGYSA